MLILVHKASKSRKKHTQFFDQNGFKNRSNGLKNHQTNSNSKKCMFGQNGVKAPRLMRYVVKHARCSGLTAIYKLKHHTNHIIAYNCYVGVIWWMCDRETHRFSPKRSYRSILIQTHQKFKKWANTNAQKKTGFWSSRYINIYIYHVMYITYILFIINIYCLFIMYLFIHSFIYLFIYVFMGCSFCQLSSLKFKRPHTTQSRTAPPCLCTRIDLLHL